MKELNGCRVNTDGSLSNVLRYRLRERDEFVASLGVKCSFCGNYLSYEEAVSFWSDTEIELLIPDTEANIKLHGSYILYHRLNLSYKCNVCRKDRIKGNWSKKNLLRSIKLDLVSRMNEFAYPLTGKAFLAHVAKADAEEKERRQQSYTKPYRNRTPYVEAKNTRRREARQSGGLLAEKLKLADRKKRLKLKYGAGYLQRLTAAEQWKLDEAVERIKLLEEDEGLSTNRV